MLLGISALGLSGCATGLRTEVSRFQAMPNPQGQSFVVVPMDSSHLGGLEFSGYAEQVAHALQAQGYARAASADQATLIVRLGYGVDEGHTEVVGDSWPGYRGYPYSYGYGYGWGYPGFYRRPYYYGWSDPFWFGGYGGSYIRSYTYYVSEVDVDIRRKVDNIALFEGKAKARSRSDNLANTVPSLLEAMFTGFPGNSGETVKITIPPVQDQAKASSY